MYRNKGNSYYCGKREKKGRIYSDKETATFIAESILKKVAVGLDWCYKEYGIEDKPDIIKMIETILNGNNRNY